jgi:hypothetical protein
VAPHGLSTPGSRPSQRAGRGRAGTGACTYESKWRERRDWACRQAPSSHPDRGSPNRGRPFRRGNPPWLPAVASPAGRRPPQKPGSTPRRADLQPRKLSWNLSAPPQTSPRLWTTPRNPPQPPPGPRETPGNPPESPPGAGKPPPAGFRTRPGEFPRSRPAFRGSPKVFPLPVSPFSPVPPEFPRLPNEFRDLGKPVPGVSGEFGEGRREFPEVCNAPGGVWGEFREVSAERREVSAGPPGLPVTPGEPPAGFGEVLDTPVPRGGREGDLGSLPISPNPLSTRTSIDLQDLARGLE